jgi:hypothetical protein
MHWEAQRAVLAVVFGLLVGAFPICSIAECGSQKGPSYDDITAIMLEQNGCGNRMHGQSEPVIRPAETFDCSAYWVLFWQPGPGKFPTQYNQFDLRDSIGSFESSATLNAARELLREDNFFLLNPPDHQITDVARSVISVKHCAVVTRVAIYNTTLPVDSGPASLRVFQDLRSLLKNSTLTRKSEVPQGFAQTLLFDP